MTTSDHQKKDEWETVQDLFQAEENCFQEPFRNLLQNFRRDLSHHPYVRRQTDGHARDMSLQWIWTRRLLAPATTLVVLVLAISFFGRPTLTWGEVVARFQEMSFFSASIYSKENGLSRPEHIELWMGQGGKVRVRLGQQLIFAERGEILAAFDLKTRKQTDPNAMAVGIIEMLGSSETFSMDTVMRSLMRKGQVNRTPVLNENAMIAEDLAVFDLESDDHDVWFRIWALKSSGLPVRMRMWDPRSAESLEVVFDYSRPQPERFFDPKAFAAVLGTVRTDQLNLAYLHLQDPGGRSYAPGVTDQNKAMEIVTTTIDGEPFSLSHYADKVLLLYFWDRDIPKHHRDWLRTIQEKYGSGEKLKIVAIALNKKTTRATEDIKSHGMEFQVLHEPGRGIRNPLAQALGVKKPPEFWLIRRGRACRADVHTEDMVNLACNGLSYHRYACVNHLATYSETTREQMRELCGEAHETETVDGKELWTYRFSSPDGERKQVVTIRFDQEGRFSGLSQRARLVNPSHVSIKLSSDFWDRQIVTGLGRENMPEANPHHNVEIWFMRPSGGGPIIGGGHPVVEIVPETLYERELAPETYRVYVRLMDDENDRYNKIKDVEILPELIIGRSESVRLIFQDAKGPDIQRSIYDAPERDLAAESRQRMLKRPDFKAMFKAAQEEERKYDDPKYLPWQLHLKEIAARYESSPVPQRMELIPKETDESYAMIQFPKNLPGHAGYSAMSLQGDLKEQFRYQPLCPRVARWPVDTPSLALNHDLVYQDDVTQQERWTFILNELGYHIDTVVEEREVYVATYDGRDLPDPETVSAPKPAGGGYSTVDLLLSMLTRAHNRGFLAQGPIFIDETGLPSKLGPNQTLKDIALSMEMPDMDQDLETLRPWFEGNFGITFTKETRSLEVFVIKKQ